MSMKSAAVALVVGVSALSLTACSAGQISQTADQVAAVDGASANSADGTVAVRDVTVVLDKDNKSAMKFTAVNQDTELKPHTLKSVTVGGEDVTLSKMPTIEPNCSVVADSAAAIAQMTESDSNCITYISTSMPNSGFAAGGTKDVVFTFDDNTTINVNATVSGYILPAGQEQRNVQQDVDTTEHPAADHKH